MSERSLQDVKVGDLVGPISRGGFSSKKGWTGVLTAVTKVTDKGFMVHGRWYDKATGWERGNKGSRSYYILATPEMIADCEARETEETARQEKRAAFQARQDYKDASAIQWLLSEMNPDNHPLDRLHPKEWAELRRRLQA